MTQDELIAELKAAGVSDATIRFAMNCWNAGYAQAHKDMLKKISKELPR